MNRFFLPCIMLGFAALCLNACASRNLNKDYFGESPRSMPDSAKVKAVLSVAQNDVKEKLSAVMFTVPGKRYRLEISGALGISAASALWSNDGWRIVFPHEERYSEGAGECVFLPLYGGVDIHKFSALMLGHRVLSIDCEGMEQELKLEYKENAAFASSGNASLKLEIKNIDSKAEWKEGVWKLNAPDKYIRHDW